MSLESPPINELVAEQNGLMRLAWILFMNQCYEGDAGTSWLPTFVNLTTTGVPTITGRYFRFNQTMCLFYVVIIPATDTSAVAGTTYISNFPLQFTNDSPCWALSGNLGDGPGMIVASNNRIYVPAWTTVTVPLTVVGIGTAR